MDGNKVAICLDDGFDERLMYFFLQNKLRIHSKQVYYSRKSFGPFVSQFCQSGSPPQRVYRLMAKELFSTKPEITLFCGRTEYEQITGEEGKQSLIYSYGTAKSQFFWQEDLSRLAALRSKSASPEQWRVVINVINECLDQLRPRLFPDTELQVTTFISQQIRNLSATILNPVSLESDSYLISDVEKQISLYQESRETCRKALTDSLQDLELYSKTLEKCRSPEFLDRIRQCVFPIRASLNAVFAKVSEQPCLIVRWKEFQSSYQVMVVKIQTNEEILGYRWVILYEEMTVIPLWVDFSQSDGYSIQLLGTNGESLLNEPVLVSRIEFNRMKSVPSALPLESFSHIQNCLSTVYADLGPGLHIEGALRIRELVHATGVAPSEIWLYIT